MKSSRRLPAELAIAIALAFLAPLCAQPAPDAFTVAATAEPAIERASLRAGDAEFAAALAPLAAALAAEPKNPALLYTRAYAHYAAVPALRAKKNSSAAIAELEKAAALLDRVRGQPWEAEAAALHSGILGQLISLKGGLAGMTLGGKSAALIDRAEKSLPNSPRVLYFRGLYLFNTPTAFGGDRALGVKLLAQSAAAFVTAESAFPGPRWGRAEALTWLGLAHQKAGDLPAARAAWDQALALEPDYGWVKFALLPSLLQKPAP